MKPRDYIRRKDNHKITAIVVMQLGPDRFDVQGPYNRMVALASEWEPVPTVTSELTNIWHWKPIEGYWSIVRDTYPENAARWLEILQGDEPDTHFKVSKRRPLKAPKAGATKA